MKSQFNLHTLVDIRKWTTQSTAIVQDVNLIILNSGPRISKPSIGAYMYGELENVSDSGMS